MKPFWVTFYSYKGGVGRSMALVNLAVMLARQSRRVVLIDFDLEAPGLDSFHELGLETKQPGVVEYAYEFRSSKVAPDITQYVQECKFKRRIDGKVWLMPSGRKDVAYNTKRVKLNWESMYDEGVGELFIENWKAALFREYKPDYVFVDSRTGLTDIGGICTLHLPDLVLLLFSLNEQNLHGINAVLQTIRNTKTKIPPQIIPVLTPLPSSLPRSEGSLYKERLDKAGQLLGMNIKNIISYNPEAALIEKVFSMEPDLSTTRICGEYKELLKDIKSRNQYGLDNLIQEAQAACKKEDGPAAKRIEEFLLGDFGDRADALYEAGQIERYFSGRAAAAPFWKRALEINPAHNEAFYAIRSYYKQEQRIDEVLELHERRVADYKTAGTEKIDTVLEPYAEDLMFFKRYPDAADVFGDLLRSAPADPFTHLVHCFNAAESARRATQMINIDAWRLTVSAFEETAFEALPISMQANAYQALHIAYACIGNIVKANALLETAANCALATGKAATMFSVMTYSYVSPEEFLQTIKQMTEALTANRLWDGMPLPIA